MKKYYLSLLPILCLWVMSCKNEGALSATAQKNKETNAAIMKAYESGDFSKMGDYIAADAVDHAGETGDIKGLDSIVKEMKRYHDMMPDMKQKVVHEAATDEYVYVWTEVEGTMQGQPTKMTTVDITKFKDGKATDHWTYMDPKELMQMMQPSRPPDTLAIRTDTLVNK